MNIGDVDTSIAVVRTLYVFNYQTKIDALLAPNPHGHPLPVRLVQPLRKAVYVEPLGDLEATIGSRMQVLQYKTAHVLAFLSEDDGGTIVTSRIFVHAGDEPIDPAPNLRGTNATKYVAATENGSYSWTTDYKSGQPGYFLTGHGATANLWRVVRMESDIFGTTLLTLRAIRLLGDLPDLNLGSLLSGIVKGEVAAHYRELQTAVANHSFRALVSHARDMAEPIVGEIVRKLGGTPGKDIAGHLNAAKALREQSKSELPGFSDLAYHVAHRIRLLHARTHPDAAERHLAPLNAELALSCVEDLKLLLREAGVIVREP